MEPHFLLERTHAAVVRHQEILTEEAPPAVPFSAFLTPPRSADALAMVAVEQPETSDGALSAEDMASADEVLAVSSLPLVQTAIPEPTAFAIGYDAKEVGTATRSVISEPAGCPPEGTKREDVALAPLRNDTNGIPATPPGITEVDHDAITSPTRTAWAEHKTPRPSAEDDSLPAIQSIGSDPRRIHPDTSASALSTKADSLPSLHAPLAGRASPPGSIEVSVTTMGRLSRAVRMEGETETPKAGRPSGTADGRSALPPAGDASPGPESIVADDPAADRHPLPPSTPGSANIDPAPTGGTAGPRSGVRVDPSGKRLETAENAPDTDVDRADLSDALSTTEKDSTNGKPEAGSIWSADVSGPRPAERHVLASAPHFPAANVVSRDLAAAAPRETGTTVELALSPDELGQVRMTLASQDGVLSMLLQAERPETLELLRRHIDVLAQEFREMGFSDLSFSFSRDHHPGPSDGKARHDNASGQVADAQSAQPNPAQDRGVVAEPSHGDRLDIRI